MARLSDLSGQVARFCQPGLRTLVNGRTYHMQPSHLHYRGDILAEKTAFSDQIPDPQVKGLILPRPLCCVWHLLRHLRVRIQTVPRLARLTT